jgi:predicted Zn finger-like uncharacterized protein
MFRVVQDQLKVSEGWVRCGRCQTVFNAQESLFDLDNDAPPPWQAPQEVTNPDPVADQDNNDLADTASLTRDGAEDAQASAIQDAEPQGWTHSEPTAPSSEMAATEEPVVPESDVHADTHADTEYTLDDSAPSPAQAREPALAAFSEGDARASSLDTEALAEVTPAFLQQAQRSERWQQPPVRRMLWCLVALSALLLGAQVIHHFRQVIAAQHPGTLPWLQGFCEITRCRIDTLQRITDVSIENTALTQSQVPAPTPDDAASAPAPEAPAMRLAITLRNRGEWAIAMPSIDLSLTGSDGELVARRSLSPADFGVSDARLAPGLDTPLSLRFQVNGGRVTGYTVEVFYP